MQVQIENICSPKKLPVKIRFMKIATRFVKGRNYCGKRENNGYQRFSPFSLMFSKDSFLGVVKSCDCVVKR